MDETDRRILTELQKDPRRTLGAVAAAVGLSLSACHRRIRALEQRGVIRGHLLDLDRVAIGLAIDAHVDISLSDPRPATRDAFEDAVRSEPAILSCHAVSGEVDYRLHVVARDLGALDTLLTRIIAALPGVGAVDSVILMRPIVAARGVPLGG